MKIKKWKERNHDEKKWFIIKLIETIVFLGAGAAFGLIAASLSGWDFVKMMTDPKTWLALLCLLGILIIAISQRKVK